ncbi:MAG: zinc dependent phospholipase C family protein [Dehalococcoidia bacterium]
MPPLGMHVALARELTADVAHAALGADTGAYYLGATSPDIRVITRWDRAETHFFDLDNFDDQSSVASVFAAHPELAAPERLDASTVSFLCGYITHLEMDEAWILDVYRPCFGERSPLKGDVLANLLDRVLQFELDRQEREGSGCFQEVRTELLSSAVQVAIGFIDCDTLTQWRDVSADVLSHPPTWDRFGVIASRHLRNYGVESEEDMAHFLDNIPDLLDQSIREVTPERLETFRERSRQRALAAVREYLW